ncbi:MAG: hypothetical protein L3J34_01210 [Flavobacteriaceae bacterium]|nr:hypothetical protein [Flavobacteriaceae bacterium]
MNRLNFMNQLKIALLFVLFTFSSYAQLVNSDSVGNFSVIKNKLVWQKSYYLSDVNELDQYLKSNPFTAKLRILDFIDDTITDNFKLIAYNLPPYAQSSYRVFIAIDVYRDYFRVTIRNIIFPNFVENYYYNGMRQNSRSGSLEDYILRNDGFINRTSANMHVLKSFDISFESIFNEIAEPLKE